MTKYRVFFLLFIMASPLVSFKRVPKIVIFGLDNTLWPFWLGTHIHPPFTRNAEHKILDSKGQFVKYYPEVPAVLEYLWKHYVGMTIASTCGEMVGARRLLTVLGWSRYFKLKQIKPDTCMHNHIFTISDKCKVEYEDMLFFDANFSHITDMEHLGIVSILVTEGMSMKVLMDGFKVYSERQNHWARETTIDQTQPTLQLDTPSTTSWIPRRRRIQPGYYRTTTKRVLTGYLMPKGSK